MEIYFGRSQLTRESLANEIPKTGFDVKEGDSPIVPIMLYDATLKGVTTNPFTAEKSAW